jgi:hypothetical protein
MGAGGNIAVFPGRDGKVLIDGDYAGARPKITAALASISSDLCLSLMFGVTRLHAP